MDGLNRFNPFFWLTLAFIIMAISVWSYWSLGPFENKLVIKRMADESNLDEFEICDDLENIER